VRQHAHTLACAYGAGDWVPCAGRLLNDLVSPALGRRWWWSMATKTSRMGTRAGA
jgi:hypothetical protein